MNETPDYAIFISYRRSGGAHFARILKAELEKRGYNERVFMDYDSLKDGKFDSRIMSAIKCAPVFAFILSPGALDRCVDGDDWVRKEIEYALKLERKIIPINFDNLFSDFPSNIPAAIQQGLGQHQFADISSKSLLSVSIDKLINERIAPIVAPKQFVAQAKAGAEIALLTDAECQVFRFHKLLTTAHVDSESFIYLQKGNHILEFVSAEYPEIKDEIRYSVPDNDYSDFIEIKLKDRVEKLRLDKRRLKIVEDSSGMCGLIDESGNQLIPCMYKNAEFFLEDEDMVFVEDLSGKYGLIDKSGKLVTPCEYIYVREFYEGMVAVRDTSEKWGFVDKSGNQVIPCRYEDIADFSEGLAAVEDSSGKWGVIDKLGNQVVPCRYEDIEDFHDGLAKVEDSSGKWGVIDKSGKLVIPCIYEEIDL